jgi:hypothetical protein
LAPDTAAEDTMLQQEQQDLLWKKVLVCWWTFQK